MNLVKKNKIAIPTRIALAAIVTFFLALCKNAGLTLNVIVLLLIYIALSITLDQSDHV
jgi:uncharacterized membrane protein YGL010W